jgi:hypothetical protein
VRGHRALSVIVKPVNMFASPRSRFQNDPFKAVFLRSGLFNRMFYNNGRKVRALLLLDNSRLNLSAGSLTSEDGQIKAFSFSSFLNSEICKPCEL